MHNFNLRRFPMLVLAGGGVGITPVLGILKDIYNCGATLSEEERGRVAPHAMEDVHAVWIVREPEQADAFLEDFLACKVCPVERAVRVRQRIRCRPKPSSIQTCTRACICISMRRAPTRASSCARP